MDRNQKFNVALAIAGIGHYTWASQHGFTDKLFKSFVDRNGKPDPKYLCDTSLSARIVADMDAFIAEQFSAFQKILEADSAHQTANNHSAPHHNQAHQPASS